LPTAISCVFIPTNENSKVAFSGTLAKVYFPSISVITPIVVPSTTTETPGRPAPVLSVTLPEIDFCCWEADVS